MNKIAIILLLSIYALATMGFSVKEFYCCGKLKSVTISITEESNLKCAKDDMKSMGCCSNQFHYFKVKDNHIVKAQVESPAPLIAELNFAVPSFQQIHSFVMEPTPTHKSFSSPPHNGVPVYLSNCVFII